MFATFTQSVRPQLTPGAAVMLNPQPLPPGGQPVGHQRGIIAILIG